MKISLAIQRILIFLAIYFLITIRNDGYFPFNKNQNPNLLLIVQVIQVLIIFGLLILFFKSKELLVPKIYKFIEENLAKLVGGLSILLILITVFLFYKNYQNFKEFYSFNYLVVFGITIFSIVIIAGSLILKRAKLAIIALFVASFALSLIPLLYFPINSKIGDLIPIIQKQLESFVSGKNIYQYYLLDNGVLTQAVRQPGTTLSYLPAFLLGIDLRFMSIIYTFGACIMLIKLSFQDFLVFNRKTWSKIKFDKKFLLLFLLIGLILLSPYRLNRLDVYEPIFWLLLTLAIYFLQAKKSALASIFFGLGIFTQVWFWLFTPFYVYYLYKNFDFKQVLKSVILMIIFGVIPLSLFVLRDTNAYYQNVFGYYGNLVNINDFNLTSFYLTPLLLKAGLNKLLTIIQVLFSGSVFLLFLKAKKSLSNILMFLCLVFFIFIQFNSLTWNYMYLDLFVFLVIYLIHANINSMNFNNKDDSDINRTSTE